MAETDNYYLELSENPIRFEAVKQLTHVFFDDSNKHVFTVRSGGVMGVVVKGPNVETFSFRMEDHGPVHSIKFSLTPKDMKTPLVLAVKRNNNSVEFMNFNGTNLEHEYSQSCKKNSKLFGFVWTQPNEIALITDHGVELYMVIPDKRLVKHLKTLSVTVEWFVWCFQSKIALLASAHGSHLQPVIFKPGCVNKLPKVETEPDRVAPERDVTLCCLYGTPAVLILRHYSGPQTAEIHVYTLSGPGQAPVKTHVLRLGLSGRFAINIVDNLILVHHQASGSSKIFDIGLQGDNDGAIRYHSSITPAKSIKPAQLILPGLNEPQTHTCELYSPHWVMFQPNIVIDAKLGCLWHINLRLPELCQAISDINICTQVALRRTNGKPVLLKLLLECIKQSKPPLAKLEESFNHINAIYKDWVEYKLQCSTASPPDVCISLTKPFEPSVIEQIDFYNRIFQKLDNDQELQKLEWILIAYITSLIYHGILPQHYINKLLIATLVKLEKFVTLQQLLQYGVTVDSKPLACLLLSLGNLHQSAFQMALDMLARLDATSEMQEILLSQGQVISALKLAQETANPRKFLEAASNTENDILFHSVLYHFRKNPNFNKDERLESYVRRYEAIFNVKTSN